MTLTIKTDLDALNYLRESKALPIVSVWAVEFAVIVSKWTTRRRTRLALTQLTRHQLRDVGLTPDQALDESAKVFWQA